MYVAYRNSTLFLLALDDDAQPLYPAGRQTLHENNARLDSGVDLRTPRDTLIPAGKTVLVDLGVRAVCLRLHDAPRWSATPGQVVSVEPQPLPWGFRLVPRSSIVKTPLIMANSEGIIDLGYRGPLKAAVWNRGHEDYTIAAGTALFQLVAADLAPPEFEVLTPVDPRLDLYFGEGATRRGAGGFGSTGAGGSASSASASSASASSAAPPQEKDA